MCDFPKTVIAISGIFLPTSILNSSSAVGALGRGFIGLFGIISTKDLDGLGGGRQGGISDEENVILTVATVPDHA